MEGRVQQGHEHECLVAEVEEEEDLAGVEEAPWGGVGGWVGGLWGGEEGVFEVEVARLFLFLCLVVCFALACPLSFSKVLWVGRLGCLSPLVAAAALLLAEEREDVEEEEGRAQREETDAEQGRGARRGGEEAGPRGGAGAVKAQKHHGLGEGGGRRTWWTGCDHLLA